MGVGSSRRLLLGLRNTNVFNSSVFSDSFSVTLIKFENSVTEGRDVEKKAKVSFSPPSVTGVEQS